MQHALYIALKCYNKKNLTLVHIIEWPETFMMLMLILTLSLSHLGIFVALFSTIWLTDPVSMNHMILITFFTYIRCRSIHIAELPFICECLPCFQTPFLCQLSGGKKYAISDVFLSRQNSTRPKSLNLIGQQSCHCCPDCWVSVAVEKSLGVTLVLHDASEKNVWILAFYFFLISMKNSWIKSFIYIHKNYLLLTFTGMIRHSPSGCAHQTSYSLSFCMCCFIWTYLSPSWTIAGMDFEGVIFSTMASRAWWLSSCRNLLVSTVLFKRMAAIFSESCRNRQTYIEYCLCKNFTQIYVVNWKVKSYWWKEKITQVQCWKICNKQKSMYTI